MGCDVKKEEVYQNGFIMQSYQRYVKIIIYNNFTLSHILKQ